VRVDPKRKRESNADKMRLQGATLVCRWPIFTFVLVKSVKSISDKALGSREKSRDYFPDLAAFSLKEMNFGIPGSMGEMIGTRPCGLERILPRGKRSCSD
jgi:hypothetical protein